MKIKQLYQDIKEPTINEKGKSEFLYSFIYIRLQDIYILEECQNILQLDSNWQQKDWFNYRKESGIDITYHITIAFNGHCARLKHCILTNEQVEQIKQQLNENRQQQ